MTLRNLGATRIQTWVNMRRAAGTDQEPFLYVNPRDNVLVGLRAILEYLGIRSPVTLYQWVELYGFPAMKRPDSQWMTTMTSIDQWIFLACEMDNENRPHSRGHNARYALARRRLDARLNEQALRKARGEEGPGRPGPRPIYGVDYPIPEKDIVVDEAESQRPSDPGEQGQGQ